MGSERTRSQSGYLARSREGSKAPPSASPPQINVPQAWGQAGAASPAQTGRPGAHRADAEAAGWVGRALPGEQSPRHALLTPRADKRSLRGCRKPRAPCPHSVGKVRPPRPAGRAHRLKVGPRPPSSRAPEPAPLRAYQLPSPTAALPPLRGAPASAGAQQWALHAAVAAAGQRPGPQGHKAARPPRPPASRRPRRGPTRERLTFPEPARPRAPPSLCLWQTWLAEKRAPSPPPPPLPSGLPSCPAPGPLPALARSLALRSPLSLPPRRWLRALSSCQSVSPGRGPIALELLPRRLGLSCAAARPKPAARLLAARAPAARLRLRRPLRLQHRCRCRRRRRWSTWSSTERGCPGRSAAGVHAPRRTAAAANRRAGAGPEAGRDACQRGRASPAAPPPRAAARSCPGQGSGGRALALGWGGDWRGSGGDWSTRGGAAGTGRCDRRRGPRLARRAPFRVLLAPSAPASPR